MAMSVQGTLSAAERSIRSVFVGNIPYEATEEQLKDIFSEVGPVVSFRLVYDRETGKPKGYGFCEYKDQETALSAMRNLNGYELNGRALRVDNAASEKNKEELKNLQAALGGPPQEQSPYGPEIESEKAPEAISKAVASLPPEQMFELMKQMKLCIQNNPSEARTMLLQNPQLAYALLQAQVVMRIVEPQVAMSMLHRSNPIPQVLPTNEPPLPPPASVNQGMPPNMGYSDSGYGGPVGPGPRGPSMPGPGGPPQSTGGPRGGGGGMGTRPSLLGDRPLNPESMRQGGPPPPMGQYGDMPRDFDMRDPRSMDPRSMGDRDMRIPPGPRDPRADMRGDPRSDMRSDPRGDMRGGDRGDPRDMREHRDPRGPPTGDTDARPFMDPRFRGGMDMGHDGRPPFDGRGMGGGGYDQRNPPMYDQRSPMYDQRDPRDRDPRHQAGPPVNPQGPPGMRPQMGPGGGRPAPPAPTSTPSLNIANIGPLTNALRGATPTSQPGAPVSTQDQEKAALIMQVLQLSDQQIAMLPPEQRQSIMVLKEQIARSTQQQ